MTDTTTALALPEPANIALLFQRGGVDEILSRIEAEAKAHAPDVSTAKGRKEIASLAYKVAQSKTALDNAGKKLNEDARQQINAVDAERRKIRDRLDALKDTVRAPLDEWEAAEDARVQKIQDRVDRLRLAHDTLPPDATSDQIAALLSRVEIVAIDDTWAEFIADASRYKDQAVATLRNMKLTAEKREADAAELARLRAEADARAEADRLRAEEQSRAEAAERAAKADAERIERIEREKKEAAEQAARDAEHRLQAKADEDRRAAAAREAELQRQAAEAEARHARDIAASKAREEAAAQAERDRIAAQAKAEADARAKREADAEHRAKIAADIAAALRTMSGNATPENIAAALIDGKIPHCIVRM